MSRKLVIFVARQIAEVCAFYFDHDSDYEVVPCGRPRGSCE